MKKNERILKAIYGYVNNSNSFQRKEVLDILLASASYKTLENVLIELNIKY